MPWPLQLAQLIALMARLQIYWPYGKVLLFIEVEYCGIASTISSHSDCWVAMG